VEEEGERQRQKVRERRAENGGGGFGESYPKYTSVPSPGLRNRRLKLTIYCSQSFSVYNATIQQDAEI
jgi:hypothetical protein